MTEVSPSPTKSSTGLDQNVAGALTYLIGFITGIVFLIVEKDNKFVRFHAMQSTMVFGGFFVLYLVLTVTFVGWLLMPLILIVQLVVWLLMMIKAFSGQMYKLPWFGEMAEKQLQKM
jgi:uncharacterized membrane protein